MVDIPSILVVDDEPDGFDVLEGILFHEGYAFSYASSGFEALKRLEMSPPDVLLLDVMMPGLDGLEVCREVKASPDWQHIPIIMVTALNAKEDLARCLEAGADDFVGKPMSAVELRARVRSMLRIKHQYDALQASLQLREDMASMMVHDLRNPLTTVLLASDVLQTTPLTPKQMEKVGQIMSAGQQLDALINSLLLLAKLDAGKMLLHPEAVNLSELAQGVVQDCQAIALLKHIHVHLQVPETPMLTWVDRTMMRRVIENLLSNAIKFSPSKSEVQVVIEHPTTTQTRLWVTDQGRGVSSELKQSIFKKYETGQIVQGVTQTGLGLAFCKLAVEAHGGTIAVTDNYPQGALFTVELIQAVPESSTSPSESTALIR